MKRLVVILLLPLFLPLAAQDYLPSVLVLTGETDAESLEGQVLEKFDALNANPLMLNYASRGELSSSGLFTPFQVASILDYRSREGDILSFMELAFVDGFNESVAAALKPFVSLYSGRVPGQPPSQGVRQRAIVRGGLSTASWNAGAKYRITAGRFEAAAAVNRPSAGGVVPGAYALWKGRRRLGKVIAGDYNVRFGQGLALWSGFSLSGLSTPEAFAKRPSGLSAAWSWSGSSARGAAADFSFGPFCLTVCADLSHLKAKARADPGANLTWYSRYGQTGLTATWEVVSVDSRYCLKGVDIFGELAYDFHNKSPAGVAGTLVPLGDFKLSVLGRCYPSGFASSYAGAVRSGTKVQDEAGVALGCSWKGFTLTVDAFTKLSSAKHGLKAVLAGAVPLGQGISLKLRATERLRNYSPTNRTDLRADFSGEYGSWTTNVRANAVFSSKYGLLGYAEQGYKTERLALWLRLTLFHADNWDDRLYSYERDAPGNFNVPAYYGRGLSAAFVGSCKLLRGRLKLYSRAALTANRSKDSLKAELKFQAVWDF